MIRGSPRRQPNTHFPIAAPQKAGGPATKARGHSGYVTWHLTSFIGSMPCL